MYFYETLLLGQSYTAYMATMNRLQATSDKFNVYAICNSVMTVKKNRKQW
jgi:hypothetical protein